MKKCDYIRIYLHKDCEWLIEKGKGSYICCDSRSAKQGVELSREEIHQKACPFIHLKEKQKMFYDLLTFEAFCEKQKTEYYSDKL